MTRYREANGAGDYEPPQAIPGPFLANSKARHGTPSGFLAHQKRGEEPCVSCRTAKAHYDWRWRNSGDTARRNRAHATAQRLAYQRLKRAHLAEYRRLYEEAKAEVFAEVGLSQRAENPTPAEVGPLCEETPL